MSILITASFVLGLSACLTLYWPTVGRKTWFTRTLPAVALTGGVIGFVVSKIVPESIYVGVLPVDFFVGWLVPCVVLYWIANDRSRQAYLIDLYAEDAEAVLLHWFEQLPEDSLITRSMIERRLAVGDENANVYQFILDSIAEIGHGIVVSSGVSYELGMSATATTITIHKIGYEDVAGEGAHLSYAKRAARQYENWRRPSPKAIPHW